MKALITDLGALLRRLRHDDGGVIAPAAAALGGVLLVAAGMALDTGLYYVGNRELRSATEAATLVAAMAPAQATARARDYLQRNGFDPSVIQQVEVGRYCADAGLAPQQRFDSSMTLCPGNGQANAVRISTKRASRRYLSNLLGPANPIPDLAATATAARIDEAGVGITSGILTVTNPLVTSVNDLLGALLGVKLVLSTADIEAMMTGDIDAGLFFDSLAQRVGASGTYGDLVNRTVPLGDLLQAAADGAGTPTTGAALRKFAGQAGNGYQVPLKGLFGLGVWKNMPTGGASEMPALRAGLNAYQLVAFAIQQGSGTIDLSDALSIVSAGSTLRLAGIATGPVDRPRFSFGPAGETSVSTSALRLQLLIGIGSISVLGNPISVDVPLIIDVGAASADISDISCPNTSEQAQDTRVTVHTNTGLINVYIGSAPANAMTSPMPPLTASDIKQAHIVDLLSLITVDARAVAQPVVGASGDLVFGPGGQGTIGTPAAPGQAATLGNGLQVGSLLTSLTSSLTAPDGLQVKILGLCLPLVCDATTSAVRSQLVSAIVQPVAGLVGAIADPLLDTLLAALGIQLGHATVRVTGARCGVPVLV